MAAPELVAPGVYRVDAIGLKNAINVLLLENDDGWTLVDTGVGSSVGRIRDAVKALGSGPEDLKRVFVTHHHGDHIGGLPGVLEWAPHAEVWAPEKEAEIVSGARPPDPSSNPLWRFIRRNQRLPTATVAKALREGDLVSGFRVVATPGHTLGHVSLAGRRRPSVYGRRLRVPATQDTGRCREAVLHGPAAGKALGGEAARRGLCDRDARPWTRATVGREDGAARRVGSL
jgi:hypothetical protein